MRHSRGSNMIFEIASKYCSENLLDNLNKYFLRKLFVEARENKFAVIVEKAETAK